MKITKVDLYKYFGLIRPEHGEGYLNCYLHENSPEINLNRTYPAMVVMPGGAYSFRSDRENEVVAIKFYANDYNAFTLQYAIYPAKYPTALIEGCMAVAYIRENAKQLGVNADNIACIGFSAGGHLCASVGNLFDSNVVVNALKERANLCRPDAILLGYPVISKCIEKTHEGTFSNLCGDNEELKRSLSIEKCVKLNSAPVFIFHTENDPSVPVKNSKVLADAYESIGVPYELHIFEKGPHGLSLGTTAVYNQKTYNNLQISSDYTNWVEMAISWLYERGFNIKD